MTDQEIFSTAILQLRKQGHRALSRFGGCQYRTDNGSMCAIGACIPPKRYNPNMEGDTITRRPDIMDAINNHNAPFLQDVQSWLHDDIHDIDDDYLAKMEANAVLLSVRYNLEIPA